MRYDKQAGTETPATRGRARASQPPEDMNLLHDFGDRGIYYRNNACDNNNRDVDDPFADDQDVRDHDFGD